MACWVWLRPASGVGRVLLEKVLVGKIPAEAERTVYTRVGDLFAPGWRWQDPPEPDPGAGGGLML